MTIATRIWEMVPELGADINVLGPNGMVMSATVLEVLSRNSLIVDVDVYCINTTLKMAAVRQPNLVEWGAWLSEAQIAASNDSL